MYKALWNSSRDSDLLTQGGGAAMNILYSPGGTGLEAQTVPAKLVEEANVGSYYFTIEMQGTSTRENKSKNVTLTLHTSDTSNGYLVFSPNYDAEDSSTFLPEQSWTLKADVVDSAHSNNTAIGKFVNALCKDSGKFAVGADILINSHQRLCLDGFPVLVFMTDIIQTVDENGQTVRNKRTYYMGYYNFNLGRSSYNNLACTQKEYLDEMVSGIQDSTQPFKFSIQHLVNRADYGVAEVNDNIAEFDFSQYDKTLLFGPDDDADVVTMYGHMVTNDTNSLKTALIALNKQVARAGYYIFQELNKEFVKTPVNKRNTLGHTVLDQNGNVVTTEYDISDAYKVPNIVNTPVYQTVYQRQGTESNYSRIQLDKRQEYTDNPVSILDVIKCISRISDTDDEDNRLTPYLDYTYTVIYYVVVMAFGMVDSVLKNLNVKTWNLPIDANAINQIATFYPMFYDMDTACELNNAGLQTIRFNAAMDYWTTQEDSSGILKESQVLRDYWPQSSDDDTSISAGGSFDFPCSYLFAIAKYANVIAGANISNENIRSQFDLTPSVLWTMLRKKGGLLESADIFVNGSDDEKNPREAFFTDGMTKAGGFFINLNYRLKYLYVGVENNKPSLSKISYFHGTRRQRVKEWLASRFYFLDQIFNLSARGLIITTKNAVTYYEPKGGQLCGNYVDGTDLTALKSNPDIYLLMDAFSDQSVSSSSGGSSSGVLGWSGTFTVTAPQNTPLVLRNSDEYKTYFLSTQGHNDNKITIVENGAPVVIPFGSGLWKDVDTLNAFARAVMYVNSDNLITARVTINAKISQWTILGKRL